jgi:hypothetical protein
MHFQLHVHRVRGPAEEGDELLLLHRPVDLASIACSLDSTSFHWPRSNSFLSMISFSDRLAGAPEPMP